MTGTLRSTTWIVSREESAFLPKIFTGSGVIVDREHRLILTNAHVVDDRKLAHVFFRPRRQRACGLGPRDLPDEQRQFGVSGKVIATDKLAATSP